MFYLDHEYKIFNLKEDELAKSIDFLDHSIAINQGESTVDEMQLVLSKLLNKKGQQEPVPEEEPKQKTPKKAKRDSNTIKVDATKLDELVTLVSELVTLNSRLQLEANNSDNDELKKTVKSVSKLSKRFRDNALELRLIPVKVLELKMQRLIRDLSKQLSKDIKFIVDGTSTELDKNIIARLESPIMHILRNSIDHGLESAEERISLGKPKEGVVKFISFYSGSNVFIQIQDDGKGIDPEKIKSKAIEKGLIDPSVTLEKSEVFKLLFRPGFSTASEITNVSGRGVGLDVVKSEIMAMRGEIDIESEIGLGTSFTLKLPLTLSIIDTLVTKVNDTTVLIPREFILQTTLLEHKSHVADKIEFNGQLIPSISLRNEFNEGVAELKKSNVVIVNQNNKQYALVVDKIYGEHQAVVKPLGYYNGDHNYFSSASVMGDGGLALILDVTKLINSKKSNSKLGKYNLK